MLIQITANHFCAGLVLSKNKVVRVADIIGYMCGWDSYRVKNYARSKGWKLDIVNEDTD